MLGLSLVFKSSLKELSRAPIRQFSTGGISTVGIVGLGLMGHGIAQIASEKFQVVACDTNEQSMTKGIQMIEKSLSKIHSKKFEADEAKQKVQAQMGNIKATTNVEDLKDCDIIIEAIIENLEIKKGFYKDLSKLVKPDAILASNTSSFPIMELSEATENNMASRVVGLHFFNPVQMMKLVEVIQTPVTDPAVFEATKQFVTAVNRVPVQCKDTPGFIVNRLLVPYLTQAIALLERGDATKEDIDTAMKLGAGHPMGPIQLADFVGLDTCLAIVKGWQDRYPDNPDYVVPPLLEKLVAEGKLGRKSGEGFYKWDK